MKISCLIKNLITENQIFGLKITILLLKLMKETMKIMTQMMKKKGKTCLKRVILKFFRCNLNDPEFDLFTFLCEINLYISKLAKKKQQMK